MANLLELDGMSSVSAQQLFNLFAAGFAKDHLVKYRMLVADASGAASAALHPRRFLPLAKLVLKLQTVKWTLVFLDSNSMLCPTLPIWKYFLGALNQINTYDPSRRCSNSSLWCQVASQTRLRLSRQHTH